MLLLLLLLPAAVMVEELARTKLEEGLRLVPLLLLLLLTGDHREAEEGSRLEVLVVARRWWLRLRRGQGRVRLGVGGMVRETRRPRRQRRPRWRSG